MTDFELRIAAKLRARQIISEKRQLCVGTGWLVFLMAVLILTLLRSIFSPTLDISPLMKAYNDGADYTAMSELLIPMLTQLYTTKNIAMMLVISLAGVVAGGPAILGAADNLRRISNGEEVKALELFRWYSTGKLPLYSVALYLIFVLICAAVFTLLSLATTWLALIVGPAIYSALCLLLYIGGYCLLLAVLGRLAPALILMSQRSLGVFASLKASVRLTKGHAGAMFGFMFSFTLWALLCAVSFGLGVIFAAPLFGLSLYEMIKEFEKRELTDDAKM